MNHEPKANDVSVNVFDQIQSICLDYRRELKMGAGPRIEDRIDLVNEEAKANLFQNLLHLEIEFRRRRGEHPRSNDYIERFPRFGNMIRQAFFESITMSGSFDGAMGAVSETVNAPPARRLGDYELVRELGRGGFGVVYEASHIKRHHSVALKTIPTHESGATMAKRAERLHRFRREFRSLADMNHPNLIGMQTLEVDADQWFFTMDLINGVDFLTFVRPDGQLDESRLRATLPQLASGIMALHGQHVVHRDLKPGNVMVTSEGRVVILDFGLVVELKQRLTDLTASMQSQHFVGTIPYAAPEQLFGTQTSASDWYAFGAMLYEALSGERPFTGSADEIFHKKQRESAQSLTGREDFPQDLARLCDQLLEREPRARPDALAIARALSVDVARGDQDSIDQLLDSPSLKQQLIGRESQLDQLCQSLDQVRSEETALALFITGRSGEGKTCLADSFLDPLGIEKEALVLSGRCYDRESVPFKAIDGVIDALVTFLRSCDPDKVRNVLPDDILMLAQLFPLLRRVEAISERPSTSLSGLDSKQIQQRAFIALGDLLSNISHQRPIVMFIDDLQWGDADSALILRRFLTNVKPLTVLFIGSYRSDEADDSPFVAAWEEQNHAANEKRFAKKIRVGPLSESQCTAMTISRIGEDTLQIRDQALELFRATGGNPYFLDQLLDCYDPDTGLFSARPLDEVIEMRLKKLPTESAPMLEMISVSGQALPVAEAIDASGSSDSAYSTINRMRKERLVRLIGSNEEQLVDTYHDKIRETVLDQMEVSRRGELHKKLGETIEQAVGVDRLALARLLEAEGLSKDAARPAVARLFDLAYHFDAAGEQAKAFAFSLLAAEQAKSQFALGVAIENFEIAERNSEQSPRELRYRVSVGYGECLVLAGRFDDASPVLVKAFDLATTEVDRAFAEAIQAELTYKHKSLPESIAVFERVCRRLGIRVPRSTSSLYFSLARQWCISLRHEWLSWSTRKSVSTKESKLTSRILNFMPYVYTWRNPLRTVWVALAAANHTRNYPPSSLLASSYTEHSWSLMSHYGVRSRAERYYNRGQKLAQELDDYVVLANWHRMRGYGLVSIGELEEGRKNLVEAASLFEKRATDFFRGTYARYWTAWADYLLGNLEESQRLAKEIFEIALSHGQNRFAQNALEIWTLASLGDLPFEELQSCVHPVPEDYVTTIQLLNAEAVWHLFHKRTNEAVEVSGRAIEIYKQHRMYHGMSTAALSTHARALRELAESVAKSDKKRSQQLWEQAERFNRWAGRITGFLRSQHPAILREQSLVLAENQRLKRAWRVAKKSCTVAEKQNARFESAKSMIVCGRMAALLGRPEGKEMMRAGESALAQFHL